MSTKIEWTKETWNPVTGCSKISPGCRNCYAERMATRLAGRFGYPADDPFRVVDNGAFGYTAVVEFSENAREALEVYTFRIEYGVSKAD